MTTFFLSITALCLISVVSCKPLIPADATITTPARLPRRVGTSGELWVAVSFNDITSFSKIVAGSGIAFSTSDRFIALCENDYSSWRDDCSRYLATACDGNAVYAQGTSTVCAVTETCVTNVFYTSNTIDKASLLQIACFTAEAQTYFEASPTGLLFTKSSSSSSPSNSTSHSATVSQTSSVEPNLSSTPPTSDKKAGKAWIAGAVIGPLALISVLGLAFLLLRRRKRNGGSQSYQVAPQMSSTSPQQQQANGVLSPPLPEFQDVKADSAQTSKTGDNRASENPSTFSHHSTAGSTPHDLPELVLPSQNHS